MPDTTAPPLTPIVVAAVVAANTPIQAEAALSRPDVTQAAIARATPAQITAAIPRIPWWKSKGMLIAYGGLGTALLDVSVTLLESKDLSWRTIVLGVIATAGAWARKNSSTIVSSFTGIGDSQP